MTQALTPPPSTGGIIGAAGQFLPPPYDPSTLQAPLSPIQKAAIIAWMTQEAAVTGGSFNPAGQSDANLIAAYTGFYNVNKGLTAPITGPVAAVAGSVSNPFSGILSALQNANTWVRVAEFLVGGIALTVGLVVVTRSTAPGAYSAAKSVNPVGRASTALKGSYAKQTVSANTRHTPYKAPAAPKPRAYKAPVYGKTTYTKSDALRYGDY